MVEALEIEALHLHLQYSHLLKQLFDLNYLQHLLHLLFILFFMALFIYFCLLKLSEVVYFIYCFSSS